jgi:hypothetical protein
LKSDVTTEAPKMEAQSIATTKLDSAESADAQAGAFRIDSPKSPEPVAESTQNQDTNVELADNVKPFANTNKKEENSNVKLPAISDLSNVQNEFSATVNVEAAPPKLPDEEESTSKSLPVTSIANEKVDELAKVTSIETVAVLQAAKVDAFQKFSSLLDKIVAESGSDVTTITQGAGVVAVGALAAIGLISMTLTKSDKNHNPPTINSKGKATKKSYAPTTFARKDAPKPKIKGYLDSLASSSNTILNDKKVQQRGYLDSLKVTSTKPTVAQRSGYLDTIMKDKGSDIKSYAPTRISAKTTTVPMKLSSAQIDSTIVRLTGESDTAIETQKARIASRIDEVNGPTEIFLTEGSPAQLPSTTSGSYLERMSVSGPPKVKAPFKAPYNPKTAKVPAGSGVSTSATSYLETMSQPISTSNWSDKGPLSVSEKGISPNQIQPATATGSYLESMAVSGTPKIKAPFKESYSPKTAQIRSSSGVSASATSYLESMSQSFAGSISPSSDASWSTSESMNDADVGNFPDGFPVQLTSTTAGSYLESMSVAGPPKVKAPFKAPYNPKTAQVPAGSGLSATAPSYLGNVSRPLVNSISIGNTANWSDGGLSNGSVQGTSSNQTPLPTATAAGSYLESMAVTGAPKVKAPFKEPYSPKTVQIRSSSGVSASATSYLESMSQSFASSISPGSGPSLSASGYVSETDVVNVSNGYPTQLASIAAGSYLESMSVSSARDVQVPFEASYNPSRAQDSAYAGASASTSSYLESMPQPLTSVTYARNNESWSTSDLTSGSNGSQIKSQPSSVSTIPFQYYGGTWNPSQSSGKWSPSNPRGEDDDMTVSANSFSPLSMSKQREEKKSMVGASSYLDAL